MHFFMETSLVSPCLLLGYHSTESEPVFLNVYGARLRFQGMNSASLFGLAGRYDNPIPPRFQAPIDCLKIPALNLKSRYGARNTFQKPSLELSSQAT
jgi:hypothetical protein